MSHNPTATRESWLMAAVEELRPRFAEVGLPLPEKVRVSVGFAGNSRAESKGVLGVCFARFAADDNINQIYISPEVIDTARVLDILLHELIHAADDNASGHKGAFAEAATRLGLEGRMTATTASIELAAEFMCLADTLGPYPHGKLTIDAHILLPVPVPAGGAPLPRISSGPAKQGNRSIKVTCQTAGCACGGYRASTTRKWLDLGNLSCPFGGTLLP